MALILAGGDGGTATLTGNTGNLAITNAANVKLSGNLQFSDNTVQSTAGLSTGKSIAMAIVFGG